MCGQAYRIDTLAGSDWSGDGGPAIGAALLQAEGLAVDSNGNVYIAEAAGHRVRQVTPQGTIRTVAGTGVPGFSGDGGPATAAQLNSPYGVACDSRGNLYIADLGNARVRRVARDGTMTTIAGGGTIPAGGPNEGSSAIVVALMAPRNLALNSAGDLLISDFNAHRVYRLDFTGTLTTVAGTGLQGFSGDAGAATAAQLAYPAGLVVDHQDSLYIADSQNHSIRKVSHGIITSVARGVTPTGLTIDAAGVLYAADPTAGQILRFPAVGNATPLGVMARDVAVLFPDVLASDGDVIHRVSSSGVASAWAGGGLAHGDGGPATAALLNHPAGVALDAAGNTYIADRENNRIRRVTSGGTITTVVDNLSSPSSVTADASGNLYVSDTGNHRVLQIPTGGKTVIVADKLGTPVYAISDSSGNVFIADASAGKLLKVAPKGLPATVLDGLKSPRGLALDKSGNVYFTETDAGRVSKLSPDGTVTKVGAGWNIPRGVAVDDAGSVFVADTGLQSILQVSPSGSVTMVASHLGFPWDVAIGSSGSLLIAELGTNRVGVLTRESISVTDVVNAASLQAGPIAPGMLLIVRGSGLAGAPVLFGAVSGQIVAADDSHIVVVVPAEIAGLQRVDVHVAGNVIPVAVADAAPGVFADTSGHVLATDENGLLVTRENPARQGSVVTFYCTGTGVAGLPVSVRIGGYLADLLYAGPAPSYPGLFQLNARIPAVYGDVSVEVTVGEASSQTGVTITSGLL